MSRRFLAGLYAKLSGMHGVSKERQLAAELLVKRVRMIRERALRMKCKERP